MDDNVYINDSYFHTRYRERISNMNKEDIYFYLKFITIILVVVALGMFIFQQWLGYKYKAELLMTPCELCTKLNPEWKQCYDFVTTPKLINENKTVESFYRFNLSTLKN